MNEVSVFYESENEEECSIRSKYSIWHVKWIITTWCFKLEDFCTNPVRNSPHTWNLQKGWNVVVQTLVPRRNMNVLKSRLWNLTRWCIPPVYHLNTYVNCRLNLFFLCYKSTVWGQKHPPGSNIRLSYSLYYETGKTNIASMDLGPKEHLLECWNYWVGSTVQCPS